MKHEAWASQRNSPPAVLTAPLVNEPLAQVFEVDDGKKILSVAELAKAPGSHVACIAMTIEKSVLSLCQYYQLFFWRKGRLS